MAAIVPVADLCFPHWYVNSSSICPYGKNLTGDITLPFDADGFDYLMVFYGFVPYAVVVGAFLALCYYRGTAQLAFLVFGGLVVFFGELVWKPLLKYQRPYGSCLFTCGMPSSHATISIGFLTWMLLEGLVRKKIRADAIFDVELHVPEEDAEAVAWKQDHPVKTVTTWQRATWWVFWVILLLPVPFSRVALSDHSWAQVTAGSFIGCGEALLFYFALNFFGVHLDRCLIQHCCVRNGKTCGLCADPFFHNNYEPNHFVARNERIRRDRILSKSAHSRVPVEEIKIDNMVASPRKFFNQ